MIHEVFNLLKSKLNTYFKTIGQQESKVDFVKATDDEDTIKFQLNQITPVLINIEEERVMRSPDLYRGRGQQGMVNVENAPEIRINLLVLFVSKFGNYTEGLNYLSHVIKFFQVNRVFDHHNSPTLSPEIEKLIMELSPPVLQEQDAVWNALRTSYLPSVLYKIKMLVYLDQESFQAASQVSSIDLGLTQKSSQTQVTYQVLDLDMDIRQTNAPTLPYIDIPITENSLDINYNTSATIHVEDTQEGITYQLDTPERKISGQEITSENDGEIITLTSDKLLVDTEFKVKATNLATGGEVYLNSTVEVFVLPRTNEISITGSDSIDSGESATIELTNAQENINYRLKINSEYSGNPENCTEEGGSVSLTSANLTEAGEVIFKVEATTTSGKIAILENTVIVEVLESVDTSLTVSGISIVSYNESATIIVEDSEEGVQYRLKNDITTIVNGIKDESINLTSNPLTADTTFTVEASSNSGESWSDLSNTHTVMVGRLYFEPSDTDVAGTIDFGASNPMELEIKENQTIEMWIKPDLTQIDRYIYFKGEQPSGNIHIDKGTVFYNYHSSAVVVDQRLEVKKALTPDKWIHLAVTRNFDIDKVRWYVNGDLDDGDGLDISESLVQSEDNATAIGGSPNGYQGYTGQIAEIRVWNVARTIDQIKNNMNKRLDDPEGEENLIGYWKLDEDNGNYTAKDSSGSGYDGVISDGIEWINT